MSTTTYVALTLPVLFGMSVLGIDQGMVRVTHGELQTAADNAAVAGVAFLPVPVSATDDPTNTALAQAQVIAESQVIASMHRANNRMVRPTEATAAIGDYSGGDHGTFTPNATHSGYHQTGKDVINVDLGANKSCTDVEGTPHPAILYVDGDIRLDGSEIIGNVGHSECLIIRQLPAPHGGSRTVHVNATNVTYAMIYAPAADIVLNGSSDVHGGLVGDTIRANGTGTCYLDPRLAGLVPGGGGHMECDTEPHDVPEIRLVR